MKNSYYAFLSLFFLLFSLHLTAAPTIEYDAPDLEYSEDACGYVLVINRSDCSQTIFCHEITGDNKVYNMGTISPGSQATVYPTSSQARVWSQNAQGDETSSTSTLCTETYIVTVNACFKHKCEANIVNDGCETVQVYAAIGGDWVVIYEVAVGDSVQHEVDIAGETLIFAYSFDDVLGTVTAKCGKTYTINDDDCPEDCVVYLTNNACQTVYVYVEYGNDWALIGNISKGGTYSHLTANGARYRFLYADGSTVANWTGWCGESYSIDDSCQASCPVYFENSACEDIHIYLQKPNDWVYLGKVAVGVTSSYAAAQTGLTYVFKYADGSTLSTWTGWCNEKHIVTDNCAQECDVFFDNDACEDVLAYRRVGSDWNYIGTLDKGVKYRFSSYSGTSFVFRYADGTEVGEWTAWCNETYTIEDDCNTSCDIHITNDACNDVQVYIQNGSDWRYLSVFEKGKTYKHASANGTKYLFRYADGTTIGTWTGWCGESYTITDECRTKCDVFFKNRTCDKLEILANINGRLVSKGFINVGQTATVHAYDGIYYLLKKPDGTSARSVTSECGKQYTAYEECPEECDAYVRNEACATLFVNKVVDDTVSSVGSVAVGDNLHLSAFEGTRFTLTYEDGTAVGEFDFECNKTFKAQQTCTTPCDDVKVLAIKIYDQETDMEVPGIGAILDGAQIDGNLLPENYYVTAEVSDATESVTLTVDGYRVCENYEPYTFPNAAHEGNNWNGGPGDHSITVDVSSEADCYTNTCQTVSVSFYISEPTMNPECTVQASASQSAPDCNGYVTLSATVSGQSTCCEGAQDALCGQLADYAGYVIDVEAVSGCADGTGIRLWAAGSSDPTFVTVDLGETVTAGNQICLPMYVKHCLNTDSTSASASILTSLEKSDGFVTLGGAIFENTDFAVFCFDLSSDTRFVKIVDNGQCSFRVDAVEVTPVNCAGNSSVNYYWLNTTGDTIATSASVVVNQIGDYTLAVEDCAGCLSVVEDINVTSLEGEGCFVPAVGGNLSLDNGDTSIDICIGNGISDAFDVVLTDATGENSAWVILDAFRNIIGIPDGPPFDLENSATAGLCIICHVSFNGELTGFEVGQNANDVGGDIDFSNEISVTKFTSGGPCGAGGLFASSETRSLDVEVGEVMMFPNPVSNILNIQTNLVTGSPIDVEIFTVDGRSVKRSSIIVEDTNQLNVEELSSNQFYLIRIQQGDKGVLVDRFFKSE